MNKKTVIGLVVAGVLVVILALSSFYFFSQYQKLKKNPQALVEEEVKGYLTKMAVFMELPKDDSPALATVTDKEKLKDQPFFAKAENGDKVFIYTKARRAILYRPSTNKLIDVVPLTINDQAVAVPTNDQAPVPEPKIRIAIYNGSTTSGISKVIEERLVEIEGIEVVAKTVANRNDYTQAAVIDLNGNYAGIAGDIAQLLGGKVQSLPDGEAKPEADILVIAGQ